MSSSEELIRNLYRRAAEIRDRNWQQTSRALGEIMTFLEAGEQLDRVFGNLVPPSQPLDAEQYQQALDEARDAPPPPPLPEDHQRPMQNGALSPQQEQMVQNWENTFGKRHPIRGGE